MPLLKRPIPVLIIAGAYLAVGVMGFVAHFPELLTTPSEAVWIEVTELLAVLAGVFLLRRRNWARWLAVAWIAFHVGLSAFGSMREVVMHAIIAVLVVWLLFRTDAARWFRQAATEAV